jgi:AcrR family transcriptional regulator
MTSFARSERVALTRETVVEAALARADLEGLEALSFRRLAADLGVTPMALYRYVSSKEELLAGMGELAYGEFELPGGPTGDWQEQLRELARAYRLLLLRHPAMVEIERHGLGSPSAAGLRVIEVLLALLRRAGFSVQEAAALHDRLARFVVALVVLEKEGPDGRAPDEQERVDRELRARLQQLPPEEFANVIEATEYLCRPAEPVAAFELAIDLMIGGLESLLARR